MEEGAHVLELLFGLELDEDGLGRKRAFVERCGFVSAGGDGDLGASARLARADGEDVRSSKERVVDSADVGVGEGAAIERVSEGVAFAKDGQAAVVAEQERGALELA